MKFYPTRPNWEKEFTEETRELMFKMVGIFTIPALFTVIGMVLYPQLTPFKFFLGLVLVCLAGFLVALYINRKNLKKEYLARIADANGNSADTAAS